MSRMVLADTVPTKGTKYAERMVARRYEDSGHEDLKYSTVVRAFLIRKVAFVQATISGYLLCFLEAWRCMA